MDEKALAVRILAALLDEPDIEHVAKLPFGKLSFASLPNMNLGCAMNRVAAEAARIAKEVRVEAIAACWAAGSTKGCREALQQLIDAETAPEKPDE